MASKLLRTYNPGALGNAAIPTEDVRDYHVRLVLDMAGAVFNTSSYGAGELVDGEILGGVDLFFVRNVAAESTYQSGVYQVVGDHAELVYLTEDLYEQGYKLINAAEGDDNSGYWTIAADGSSTNGNSATGAVISSIQTVNNITVCNLGSADLWVQLFDATSAPANGSVPLISIKAPAESYASLDFGPDGRPLDSGSFYICASTTKATKTLDATNSCLFDATYSISR